MVPGANLEPGTLVGHYYREYAYDRLFFELDSRRFALITSYVTLSRLFCKPRIVYNPAVNLKY